jgi:lipid-A-disaccharide synthase-like uncharacterized protein
VVINWLWSNHRFLGIEWHFWKVIGWLGNLAFFSRFFIQWYASEKQKRVVVPVAFWWLSLVGSLLLLAYSLKRKDSVFIFAYAFTWIPYIRNLVLQKRSEAQVQCHQCASPASKTAKYCSECGCVLKPGGATPDPAPHAHPGAE